MRTTGIVRPIDELGRIVIPKELRKIFQIKSKDELEILVEQDSIILRKYEPACIFCGETQDVITYNDRIICSRCVENMRQIKEEN